MTTTSSKNTDIQTNTNYFQAIGVLRGEIQIEAVEKKKHFSIKIGEQLYPLIIYRTNWGNGHIANALEQQIKKTDKKQTIVVYPRIIHYPEKDKPYSIGFQLVSFVGEKVPEAVKELLPGEFKLCGLWQFIPVCRQPVVSISKNLSDERIAFIKRVSLQTKVAYTKSTHIPVLWRDSPVMPFRFNPKSETKPTPYFVGIKATFIPKKNVFGFSSLLTMPTQDLPQSLKTSKKDKNEVMLLRKTGKLTKQN